MIPSIFAPLSGASAYRKVVAVLLAGCVAAFVLGQAAGHQPHRAAAVTSPVRAASMVAGALGTPVVAPPHIVVPLSAPRAHQGDNHGGKHHGDDGHDGDGHDVPRVMPFPNPHHSGNHSGDQGGDHHKDGAPMPPVPGSEDE
ncbi:MAG TPA: hypothetical protein VJQ45_10985 [Ktedonobacterales bacterium]|nr:hypothetical protein [Ktedonobacterales bacterium]